MPVRAGSRLIGAYLQVRSLFRALVQVAFGGPHGPNGPVDRPGIVRCDQRTPTICVLAYRWKRSRVDLPSNRGPMIGATSSARRGSAPFYDGSLRGSDILR